MKINSIKIFGERHSGTNAIGFFVGKNFDLKFNHYDYLGWKHRLAPLQEEWIKFPVDNCLFVICLRNPYSWLKAMHAEPYYEHYPKIRDLSFYDFVSSSIEDYENSICMWNKKTASYLRLVKEVPHAVIIRIEDFHQDQDGFYKTLTKILGNRGLEFTRMDEYINGRGKHDYDIGNSLAVPKLESKEIEYINSFLSNEIMHRCDYPML